MSPLNAAICTTTYLERQICYGPDNKILFKTQLFGHEVKVKVQRRSRRYATHRLMVMQLHSKHHWSISKDTNVMARTCKYYLRNNYLALGSKVTVQRKSLRYATHRLMIMQHIPDIIDLSRKKQLFYLVVKGQRPTKVIAVRNTQSYGHATNSCQ